MYRKVSATEEKQSSSGGLSDKDDLILEAFEDNVTLAQTLTTDHPDLTIEEINIEKAFLSKTLVHLSSNNVGDNNENVDNPGDCSEDEDEEEEEVDEARQLLFLKMTPLDVVPGKLNNHGTASWSICPYRSPV